MSSHYPFYLEPLPYAYDELEPYITAQTLHFHHDKHLKTYVDNLNAALEPYPRYHGWSLEQLISQYATLPVPLRTPVRNNGGGVFNHNLYFICMGRNHPLPSAFVLNLIQQSFGSLENWKAKMKEVALGQFGSGWAWLLSDYNGRLSVMNIQNQDVALSRGGAVPILPIDVWEHAYYLQVQNRRGDYVENWLSVIDWDIVERRIRFLMEVAR